LAEAFFVVTVPSFPYNSNVAPVKWQTDQRGGAVFMTDLLLSFFVSVLAGVVSNWLYAKISRRDDA